MYCGDNKSLHARFKTFSDGSCLFHALAFALNYKGCRGVECENLRRAIGIQMRERLVQPNAWNKFVAEMGFEAGVAPTARAAAHPRIPADDFVINFVSHSLDLCLIVVQMHDSGGGSPGGVFPTRDLSTLGEHDPVAVLAWIDNNHFEPILRLCNPKHPRKYPRFRFANSAQLQGLFERKDPVVQQALKIIELGRCQGSRSTTTRASRRSVANGERR